jgi:hypothetical protein
MSVDLRGVIVRLLVMSTGSLGTLVACRCPPTVPDEADEEVAPSPELAALLQADLDAQREEGCDQTCDEAVGEAVGVWTCAWDPAEAFVPATLTCSVEGADERVEVIEFSGPLDTGVIGASPPPTTATTTDTDGRPVAAFAPKQATCREICRQTDGWQLALDAGYDDANVHVACAAIGTTTADAFVTCAYLSECIGGRRPLVGCDGRSNGDVGGWWAAMARLEAASVPAFTELARDLEVHGAPADLIARAGAAADDERVHTRLCVARARAHGIEVLLEPVAASPTPDLRTLAEHNAVEGCVREAFAALEAGWQATHAAGPEDRAVLARIHDDEVRHGQLAWDIHQWARQRLGAELDGVVARAFEALAAEAAAPSPPALQAHLGLPAPATRQALARGLAEALLAA